MLSGLKNLDLYLKDEELSKETMSGFPAFVTDGSFFKNYHRLPEVSE